MSGPLAAREVASVIRYARVRRVEVLVWICTRRGWPPRPRRPAPAMARMLFRLKTSPTLRPTFPFQSHLRGTMTTRRYKGKKSKTEQYISRRQAGQSKLEARKRSYLSRSSWYRAEEAYVQTVVDAECARMASEAQETA